MNKVKKFSFVLAGLLISCFIIPALFSHDLMLMSLLDFNALFNQVYVGMALLILLGLILTSNSNIHNFSTRTAQGWVAGFVAILLISALMSYQANPHNRFPVQKYPFTVPIARAIKTALHEKLDDNPQLIIMGTSRAFTLSPEYVYQKTGYKAFNFSVEGARLVDYVWQLDYILHQKRNPPQALLIDIGAPHIPSGLATAETAHMTFSFQPFSMLPYLSLNQKKDVIVAYGEDILSLRSFSDSLFLITHPHLTPDVQTWTFQENGYAIRRSMTKEIYEDALQYDLNDYASSPHGGGFFCRGLEREGIELLEELIASAEQHHIGVILYQSPVNRTALRKLFFKNEQFYHCQNFLTNFMDQLKKRHNNVWYISLIDYQPVINLGYEGFYDINHLTPSASQAVIDKLIPSIRSAIQWSEAQKK